MTAQALAPAPAPCLTRRKTRQRTWAFLPGWAPRLHPFPSIRTSSETLGDGKSISRQLSLELRLGFHLQPTIHLGRTGENTSSKTQQKQGRGASNWGTSRLKCILQVLVYHQKDIWISTEIWCIIISISLSVSGGLTEEQTKDKFRFFCLCHTGLDPNFRENIQGPHLEMNFARNYHLIM